MAGIHGVTTVPEFRGRGIGTAMTLSPIIDARRRGYAIGVLFPPKWQLEFTADWGFRSMARGTFICGRTQDRTSASQPDPISLIPFGYFV